MSTTQPRLPSFVSRPASDQDIYETDEYYETDQIYGDQFIDALFNDFASEVGIPYTANRFVPPPPNVVPARPAYETPDDYSYTGFRVLPPFRRNSGNDPKTEDVRRSAKPRTFILIFEDATGRYFIGARVTRKAILIFVVAVMLITLGIESIPGAFDFLINIIW